MSRQRHERWLAITSLALAVCACGVPEKAPEARTDDRYELASRSARLALENEQTAEAARQYRSALARAQETDDIEAIGDASYNLAVVELRSGNAREALRIATAARAEIERRHAPPVPALLLVQAASLYRLGRRAESEALADGVIRMRAQDSAAADRAHYVKGLILADRGDSGAARREALSIASSTDAAAQTDRRELLARAALLEGDTTVALQAADRVAIARRELGDYRGMAGALALAGESAQRSQDSTGAADRFMRAGRSALLQGDFTSAEAWLRRALGNAASAGASGLQAEIDSLLRETALRRASRT